MPDLNNNNPITADGDYDVEWYSGRSGVFGAAGTFGGGTLKLQYKVGETWVDFTGSSLTEDGGFEFVSPVADVQVALSGATSPNINVVITRKK